MSYEIKEPNEPMTWKQGITIRNLGGGDVRPLNLTRQQASDKIGELMAAKNGGESQPNIEFEALFKEAIDDGYIAGTTVIPTPMIVSGYEHEPVMDGACGFAWVNFKMKKGLGRRFGKWLIDNDYARKDNYYGGCTIWIGAHGQSMARKTAHAHAMAETLQRAGIEDAHGMSRMD